MNSLILPYIDPVFLHLGPLQLRWYGLMYLLGFVGGYALLRRWSLQAQYPWRDRLSDLLFYVLLGVILGGRLGYVLFYKPAYYGQNPWQIVQVWQGGMSFHGGLLGVVVATLLYCWRTSTPLWPVADLLAGAAPIGLGLGRMGNFINGELWGRPTDLPWGVIFPGAGMVPRHPSQLYEAFLEGIVLFLLLLWLRRKPLSPGVLFFIFLTTYGIMRFVVEFVRQPDSHLGLLALNLSLGQYLCLPMIMIGLVGVVWRMKCSIKHNSREGNYG
jgi:phosphatidylglycerol:prolipoprotein diacylglycerol transferase